jgi:phage terminase Nu1 subunit (DNA packaging protein)
MHAQDPSPASTGERPSYRGSPTQEPERYVSRHELAALMGVSIATIDRMVAEGMPSVTWGRRTRRFKVSAAIAWARAQQRAA